MAALVRDQSKGLRGTAYVKDRIANRVLAAVIAGGRGARWRGMVEYILSINSNIEVLALSNLNVFAQRRIHAPMALSDNSICIHVPNRSRQRMFKNNITGYGIAVGVIVVNKSQCFDTRVAASCQRGGNQARIAALRIRHLHVFVLPK